MALVYVLEQGDYSDRRIVGVFSTPEAADAVCAGHNDYDVSAYELDELVGRVRGETYAVRIALEDGTLGRCSEFYDLRHPERCSIEECKVPYDNASQVVDGLLVVSPISFEHAEKVAVEKRQEWLRTRPVAPPLSDAARAGS